MNSTGKDPLNTHNLRTRSVILVNTFILLPIFLGFIGTGFQIANHSKKYKTYIQTATLPVEGRNIFHKTKNIIVRGYKMVEYQPFSKEEVQFLLYGYLVSILGAAILSRNIIFKKNAKIEDALRDKKKFKEDGKTPWTAIWTPDAIYFEAYFAQGNPDGFVKDAGFWTTVNFIPDEQKGFARKAILDDNKYEFVVFKKYELPSMIEFKYVESNENK